MSNPHKAPQPARPTQGGALARVAIGFTAWAERWYPDAFIFVAIAAVVGSLRNGARQRRFHLVGGEPRRSAAASGA